MNDSRLSAPCTCQRTASIVPTRSTTRLHSVMPLSAKPTALARARSGRAGGRTSPWTATPCCGRARSRSRWKASPLRARRAFSTIHGQRPAAAHHRAPEGRRRLDPQPREPAPLGEPDDAAAIEEERGERRVPQDLAHARLLADALALPGGVAEVEHVRESIAARERLRGRAGLTDVRRTSAAAPSRCARGAASSADRRRLRDGVRGRGARCAASPRDRRGAASNRGGHATPRRTPRRGRGSRRSRRAARASPPRGRAPRRRRDRVSVPSPSF